MAGRRGVCRQTDRQQTRGLSTDTSASRVAAPGRRAPQAGRPFGGGSRAARRWGWEQRRHRLLCCSGASSSRGHGEEAAVLTLSSAKDGEGA